MDLVLQSTSNQTDVALALSSRLLSTEAKTSNSVFSPLSIQVVLGLIAAGSKGATLDQLLTFLKFDSSDHLASFASAVISVVFADGSASDGPLLSLANGVWVDKSLTLKPSFQEIVENAYKASANQVDFQTKADEAVNEVNTWAEKATNGLIKDLLTPGSVDELTRLILANSVYFKGAWNQKFDVSATKDYDFYLLDGSSVRVPFMTTNEKQFVSAFEGFKVLRLPYKQGQDKRQFSMYFFLPDAKDGLPALWEQINAESGFLDRHIPGQQAVGEFRIPKFKISFQFEASETIKGLGLVLPFSNEADLTDMAVDSSSGGRQDLRVSGIFHKSFIEVNEEGTEAAAASGVVIGVTSLPPEEDFIADHPFLFLIREETTGVVLFVGHVLQPSQAE